MFALELPSAASELAVEDPNMPEPDAVLAAGAPKMLVLPMPLALKMLGPSPPLAAPKILEPLPALPATPNKADPLPSCFALAGDPNMLLPRAALAVEAPKMLEPLALGVRAAGDSNKLLREAEPPALATVVPKTCAAPAELASGVPNKLVILPMPKGDLVAFAAAPPSDFATAGDAKMLALEAEVVVRTPKMLEPLASEFAMPSGATMLLLDAGLTAAAAPKMLEPPVSCFDVAGDANML